MACSSKGQKGNHQEKLTEGEAMSLAHVANQAVEACLHADIYTNHLHLADFLREWTVAVGVEADSEKNQLEQEYLHGYAHALSDIIEHLRSGDGLPGGPVYARVARPCVQA